jgi:hypothetical protein
VFTHFSVQWSRGDKQHIAIMAANIGNVHQDNSVSTASHQGLDGLIIESPWRRDFPLPPRPALETTQPPEQWVPGLFPGGKAARAWRYHPPPSSTDVTGTAQLHLYSPSGPSQPVLE